MNGEEGKLCVSERPPIDKAPNGGRGNEIYLLRFPWGSQSRVPSRRRLKLEKGK